ncbi:MAG: hypothetical protein ABEJ88_07300 [Halobacterium sp.]
MAETATDLVAELRDRVGDDLRVAGRHDADDWTIEYLRDDLRETYGVDAVDDIADDLVLNVLGDRRQQDLYDLGDLRATVRLFEDGFVVHVPTGDRGGYLVSLDQSADVMGQDVVAVVRDALA